MSMSSISVSLVLYPSLLVSRYDDQCWVVSNGLTGPSNPNTSEVRLKVEITDLGIRRSPNCLAGWIEVRAGMYTGSRAGRYCMT